jgi:glutamyl-tRNA synthetase
MWMYKAFGWEPPKFGHVSLLTDKNGQKLSKREGSIDVRSMRDDLGVFPETLTNFVALLGWSHGQKSDVMSLEDLIKHVRPNIGMWDLIFSSNHFFRLV